MKKPIEWFASNHVAANLLMLFFVVGGLITLFSIKLEVFPETDLDRVSITVEYPGASPAEVEEAILTRIEERVAGVTGIKRIDSTALEGVGTVVIEVQQGWDTKKLLDDVKSEVDRLTTLPDEAEQPVVTEMTRQTQVLWLAVYGDAPEPTLKYLAESMQDDLTNLPGITLVQLFGVRTGEISIEVSEHTLRKYGLTLERVAQAVKQASLDLPAGRIKTKGSEILVRAKGKRYRASQYANVPVLTKSDGTVVTLGQIATLRDDFEDSDLFARYQGKPAALIQIYRVADQNALTVAQLAKDYMERIEPQLPAGVHMGIFGDRSAILKSRMDLLLTNMAMGLCLVILLLGLFLEVRLAFWVTIGIPVSFLICIWFLPFVDISINMVSLFGFILVLGIVVDDAIVVGENIFKKREQGVPPLRAAIQGAQEVGGPVIFSVLTTMVAFAPLLIGSGTMGKIMRNVPWVVILVLLGSLLESLFVLPAHLAHSKLTQSGAAGPGVKKERAVARWLKWFTFGPYLRLLRFCLRWRYATLGVGVAILLLALGMVTGGVLKFTLFPRVESDILTARISMAAGTPIQRTTEVATLLENRVAKALAEIDAKRKKGAEPLLEYSAAIVGYRAGGHGPAAGRGESGGHVATVYAQLLAGEKRDVSANALNSAWRKKVGRVPDADNITFTSELFSAGNPVEVHLSAPSLNEILAAADKVKDYLEGLPGVSDVADSFVQGKEELQIDLKPTGRALGLTLGEISRQVRHAFYGAEALRLQRGKDEVKVMVRYPESERRSLNDVERMRIHTPSGQMVPFGQVAQVSLKKGYSKIERAQRRRVIKVTADVDEKITNAARIRATLEKTVLPELRRRYPELRYDMEGAGREQKESLSDIAQGFVLALFGIYILLAIPFKSFSQPLVVMAAIPFGAVGAVIGHLLLGYNLSLLSLFGLVGLSGVVVNDSLLLIFTANNLRKEEETTLEAIAHAGCLRMRPILLTSITTFAGLIPIIVERSLQAQFLIPMAVSLGFGVLFATGITLLLIPCGYLVLDDMHNLGARIHRLGRRMLLGDRT